MLEKVFISMCRSSIVINNCFDGKTQSQMFLLVTAAMLVSFSRAPTSRSIHLGLPRCKNLLIFLCLGVIVCVLYIVSGLFVVLLVLCFTSLVSFTGVYNEDEP